MIGWGWALKFLGKQIAKNMTDEEQIVEIDILGRKHAKAYCDRCEATTVHCQLKNGKKQVWSCFVCSEINYEMII